MKCPDLVADDLSGFWGVPNRGIGMRPELPRANGVGVMGTGPVQAGALTSAIDRPLPGDHPEMEDFARAAGFRRLAPQIALRVASTPATIAALKENGISITQGSVISGEGGQISVFVANRDHLARGCSSSG